MAIKSEDRVRCSFCGKTAKQVHKLIAGLNNNYICDECVELCQEILSEETGNITAARRIPPSFTS